MRLPSAGILGCRSAGRSVNPASRHVRVPDISGGRCGSASNEITSLLCRTVAHTSLGRR
jgi:hypothetical protein